MVEKVTDIEMKPLEPSSSMKRQSFSRQHVYLEQHLRKSESVNVAEKQSVLLKSNSDGDNGLKVPCTWRLLEEFKYSLYIKRFFRFIALINILSLALNGPAVGLAYLRKRPECNDSECEAPFCEDTEKKRIQYIIILVVDVILTILYSLVLYIRLQNSRYWHKLQAQKVFAVIATVCSMWHTVLELSSQ